MSYPRFARAPYFLIAAATSDCLQIGGCGAPADNILRYNTLRSGRAYISGWKHRLLQHYELNPEDVQRVKLEVVALKTLASESSPRAWRTQRRTLRHLARKEREAMPDQVAADIRTRATILAKKMNYLNLTPDDLKDQALMPVVYAVRSVMDANAARRAARLHPASCADDVAEAEKRVDAAIQEYIAQKEQH